MPKFSEADVQPGDVVQIERLDEPRGLSGCLAEVDQVYGWGVRAFVRMPLADGPAPEPRAAYVRLEFGSFCRVWTRRNVPTVTELVWESSKAWLTIKMFNVAGDPFGAHHDIGRAFLVRLERKRVEAERDHPSNALPDGFEATFSSERDLDQFLHGLSSTLGLFGESTFPPTLQNLLIRYAQKVEAEG